MYLAPTFTRYKPFRFSRFFSPIIIVLASCAGQVVFNHLIFQLNIIYCSKAKQEYPGVINAFTEL